MIIGNIQVIRGEGEILPMEISDTSDRVAMTTVIFSRKRIRMVHKYNLTNVVLCAMVHNRS